MAIARQDVNISSPEATTSDAQSTANPTVLVLTLGLAVYLFIERSVKNCRMLTISMFR